MEGNNHKRTTNRSSWLILVASFFIYWICVYFIASVMDSYNPGIEQYFLRVISEGIDLSPLVGLVLWD
jgi:hypothetical protein